MAIKPAEHKDNYLILDWGVGKPTCFLGNCFVDVAFEQGSGESGGAVWRNGVFRKCKTRSASVANGFRNMKFQEKISVALA